MKPVLIIPTYVCGNIQQLNTGVLNTYDHMTALDQPGELGRCLESIAALEEKAPIVILVVSEKGVEEEAVDKIRFEASCHPDLDITVIGASEEEALHGRMLQMGIGEFAHGICLSGYGPSRNLGLVYAAAMGYTAAIFIDDDEVIEDDDFIEKACYGLGMLTQNEIPILIKSGFYLDANGSYRARDRHAWYNHFWRQHQGFNTWIESAMQGPRLSSSNTACGGCLALHREAFKRVSFDPWISRGEDLDFLLNVRMYGSEVWFDNQWKLRHLPPLVQKTESRRFTQDIYRWLYEQRKLEFSATQIDLLQVTPRSLNPYPGPFLDSSVNFNIFMTALLRSIARAGHRKGYFHAAMTARKDAKEYAKEHCSGYFTFQHKWPEVLALLEEDIALKGIFENAAVDPLTPEELEELAYDDEPVVADPFGFAEEPAAEPVPADISAALDDNAISPDATAPDGFGAPAPLAEEALPVEGEPAASAPLFAGEAISWEDRGALANRGAPLFAGEAISWEVDDNMPEARPDDAPEAGERQADGGSSVLDRAAGAASSLGAPLRRRRRPKREEKPRRRASNELKKSPFEDVLREYGERAGDASDD